MELFGQYLLPFGACAKVHGFCRTSFGPWNIGVRLLCILWTVYFDDFVVFEERALCRHCESVVSTYFKMLGWATSIDRENEFAGSLIKALGILMDLSDVKPLCVRFANIDERRFEVCHDIRAILKAGRLGRSEGQRIRGRLLFAESQIHGRRSDRHMQMLSKHLHRCLSPVLYLDTKEAREFFCNKLEVSEARYISPLANEVIHLYSDTSYEPDSSNPAGLGRALVNPDDDVRCHVSEFIERQSIASWNFAGSKRPIYEFELVATLIGLKVFSSLLQYKAVVVFTDNEGALGSLISCKSENVFGQKLVECICNIDESIHAFIWYERVNTSSNIADIPSRGPSLCDGFGELDVLRHELFGMS